LHFVADGGAGHLVTKRKILIVDDEIIVVRELDGRLTRLGYEVVAIGLFRR